MSSQTVSYIQNVQRFEIRGRHLFIEAQGEATQALISNIYMIEYDEDTMIWRFVFTNKTIECVHRAPGLLQKALPNFFKVTFEGGRKVVAVNLKRISIIQVSQTGLVLFTDGGFPLTINAGSQTLETFRQMSNFHEMMLC